MRPDVCKRCVKFKKGMTLQEKRQTCYNCRDIYKYDIMEHMFLLEEHIQKLENEIMVKELLKDVHKDIDKKDEKPLFGGKRYEGKGFKWSKEVLLSIEFLYLSSQSTVLVSKILGMSQKTVWRILARDYTRQSTIDFIDSIIPNTRIERNTDNLFKGV